MQTTGSSQPQSVYQVTEDDEPVDLEQQEQPPSTRESFRKSLVPVVLLSAVLFIIYHVTQIYKYHSTKLATQSFIQIHASKTETVFATQAEKLTESLSIFLVSAFAVTFDLLGGLGGPVIFQVGYWVLCDWRFIGIPNLRVAILLIYIGFMFPYIVRIWRLSKFMDRLFTPIYFGTAIAGGILGTFFLVVTYDMIWVVRSMGFLFLVTLLFNLIHSRFRSLESDNIKRLDNELEEMMGGDVFDSDAFQFSQYWLVIAGLVQGTLNGIFAAGGPAMNLYSTQYRTPTKLRMVSMLIGFGFGNGLISIFVNGLAMSGFASRDLHMYLSAFFGGLLAVLLSLSCEGVLSQSRFDNTYRVFLGAGAVLMFSLGTEAGRIIGYIIGAAYFALELIFFSFIIVMSTFWRNQDEEWYFVHDRPN